MRKRLTSLLLAVLMVCTIVVSAAAAESGDYIGAKANGVAGMLTLQLTAQKGTTNGKISVAYNASQLYFVKDSSKTTVCSVKEENGRLVIGYATSTANAIEKDEEIVTLTFYPKEEWTVTKLTVTVENFNDEETVEQEIPVTARNRMSGTGSANKNEGADVSFSDVKDEDWFSEAVKYVVGQGYFKGISDTEFGPYQSMNRAMFVTVLGRMSGVDATKYTNEKFTDVPAGSYYEGYVVWAAEQGIVQGTSDTTFSPDAAVTREQMAAFLYRYAKYLKKDVSTSGDLSGFQDAASVSDWAVSAVQWAVGQGIITGTDRGLEPSATANRAQVAQIIYRFDNLAQ